MTTYYSVKGDLVLFANDSNLVDRDHSAVIS